MTNATWWWVLVGAALAVEMLTGTFYLLLVSTGLAAAALAAHLGAGLAVQIVVAAVVGAASVVAWKLLRRKHPAAAPAASNPDVNLDIGEAVQIARWEADGTAYVQYRGARWTVVPQAGAPRLPGSHRVVEVVGNRLVVAPA